MIERTARSPEVLLPAELMAAATEFWLSEEIKNSMAGSNAYLDNMGTFNIDGGAKSASHYDRLELWTEQFAKDPTDMRAITMQMFGVHTGLSGAYRTQCYILAKSPSDYVEKRRNGPLGIDIVAETNNRLVERFGRAPAESDLAIESISVDELITQTKDVNRFRLEVTEKLHQNPKQKQGMHILHHHLRLQRLQKQWLHLGVDYMLHTARINGGRLDELEFLEPLPITQAKTYKPFAV